VRAVGISFLLPRTRRAPCRPPVSPASDCSIDGGCFTSYDALADDIALVTLREDGIMVGIAPASGGRLVPLHRGFDWLNGAACGCPKLQYILTQSQTAIARIASASLPPNLRGIRVSRVFC
jgi:hypothetical protein